MTWIRAAAIAAVVYPTVGVSFSIPPGMSSSHGVAVAWRLAAWLVAAVTFTAHLAYEHVRLRNPPLRAAIHSSAAVALGAFLLAIWVNVRLHWAPQQSPLAPLALILFPALAGVPAFLVGLTTLAAIRRLAVTRSARRLEGRVP
jgi:hypothetical protein